MTNAEKISIALPPEMVAIVRNAVATGEYASSSEVIRDALRDWTYKRNLRQQGVAELRKLWQEALQDKTPGIGAMTCSNALNANIRPSLMPPAPNNAAGTLPLR